MEVIGEGITMDGRGDPVYKAYYFSIFGPVAVSMTYLNLHLKRLGWDDPQLGVLSSILAIMAVISPPIWGLISDLVRDRRKPVLALLLVSGLLFPLFFLRIPVPGALALAAFFSFFNSPITSVSDALALDHIAVKGGDYGRIRLWGSAGFIFPLLLFFALLRYVDSLLPVFLSFSVLRALSIIMLIRIPKEGSSWNPGSGERGFLEGLRDLLTDIRFAVFLFIVFVSGITMQVYYVFFSIYLDRMMVPDNLKGIFWAIGVISEIAFMAVSGRVVRAFGVKAVFLIGLLGRAARLFLLSFPLSMAQIAVVQTLHALTFGAFHIASVNIVNELVPQGLRGSGQTLYYAMSMGLSGAVGSIISGWEVKELGIFSAFRVSGYLALFPFLLAIFFKGRRTA
jgi:PPP family 3-phenylpropionic acid transporter